MKPPRQNPASAAVNPVAQPGLPATISGTTITVDDYVQNPTRIPGIVRNLVAANRGYFAERILPVSGQAVQGGAVIFEQTFPEDFFLPADQSLAPRAPGSEAPRLGSTRRAPTIAHPESWSGQIEVTDEARRRNNVLAVQRQFQQAANTFANILQLRAIEVMEEFITEAERTEEASVEWDAAHSEGIPNEDPLKLIGADLALVAKVFEEDEAGVQPDLLILNPADAFNLRVQYQMAGGFDKLLSESYGLTILTSMRVEKGNAYFVKEGALGATLYEIPMTQEQERAGTRKADLYILEAVPVFVAFDATAVLKLTKINE